MIYNFESDSRNLDEFVSLLVARSLDYEVVRKDRVVVRVFGQVDEHFRRQLDVVAGREKLIMKKGGEEAKSGDFFPVGQEVFIAGPCSVESAEQIDEIAGVLSELGIKYLRGGAFKPRTNSDSFQGLGRTGLKLMAEAAAKHGMKVVTELMDRSQLDEVTQYADVIQVGSRNMFNYSLLTALGAVDKPVLLKRSMAATIDEWLSAADYVRKGGNHKIILCERGIRTFEPRTRFTLDILAVSIAQRLSGLPVVVDVSHAAGERTLVPPLIKAALAGGADGIMVEVHPNPDKALSDSSQSMTLTDFRKVYENVRKTAFPGPA